MVLSVTKATLPGKMVLDLRREVARLHEQVMTAEDADEIVKLSGAANAARNQLLDILGWPKRPASPHGKTGRLPAPVDILPADIRDAAEVPPGA